MMSVMVKDKSYRLLNNSRFYILASSVLLSAAVFAWLRLQIPGDQLLYIRAQQIFGLLAVVYLYIALIVSPVGHVIGKHRTKHLEFARRAIGVSSFYFALLHGSIALWAQLGGVSQLQYLPSLFHWSLLAGALAFGVLLILAATSFDKIVSFMTFRKWKWLHRMIYAGCVLIIFHVWSIGTHLAYAHIQVIAFLALVVLLGLESFSTIKQLNNKRFHLDRIEMNTLFVSVWVMAVVLVLMIPNFVQNYHNRHGNHRVGTAQNQEKR